MAEDKKGAATQPLSGKSKDRDQDLGQAELQKRFDEAEKDGFLGTEVDPTPNENYTVAGVTSGKPTPETDEKTRAKAREAAGLR
jgi:hypothetical protein